jgi:hypothetical protein
LKKSMAISVQVNGRFFLSVMFILFYRVGH